MSANPELKVWFDFNCPYCRIAAVWLENAKAAGALPYKVSWMTFSLEYVNLPSDEDADRLWATAPERRGLLPLAAAKWAAVQGADTFDRVFRGFLSACHVDGRKIGRPEVVEEVLSKAGLDGASIMEELLRDRRWLDLARADHEEGAAMGIFGVPTFVFPGARPLYLLMLEATEKERAAEVFGKVEAMALDPLFQELKRPSLRR